MNDFPDEIRPQLDLTYPVRWRYQIIGRDADELRAILGAAAGDADHGDDGVRPSRTGSWVSLHAWVDVRSEDERLGIHRDLVASEAVRYVL